MRQAELQANLETTLGDMRDQIGLEAGEPTDACDFVVLGAMTGARLDFTNIPTEVGRLYEVERQKGLYRAQVYNPGVIVIDAVRLLLEQDRLSFNGIIAQGRLPNPEGRVLPHAIAVVVDVGERRKPLGIVDSLLVGGFRSLGDEFRSEAVTDAAVYVQGRFLPNRPGLYLGLNEEQRSQFRGGNLVELPGRIAVGLQPPPRR